jgi:hypothetical protein
MFQSFRFALSGWSGLAEVLDLVRLFLSHVDLMKSEKIVEDLNLFKI